jgi:hypothetical protein
VLLYLTPLHCQDMLDSVVTSLNATVAKFMARNPSFTVQMLLCHSAPCPAEASALTNAKSSLVQFTQACQQSGKVQVIGRSSTGSGHKQSTQC